MPRLLVLSGLPASGKTSLAQRLSEHFDLAFFDKDHFLERLFEGAPSLSGGDPRTQLSRQADLELEAAVRQAGSAVVASWWRHPQSTSSSGTVPWWLHDAGDAVVEVHCNCSPEVAVSRFMERRRHPGHNDARWSRTQLLASFVEQAALGPLHPLRAIGYGTESPINTSQVAHLAQAIAACFSAQRAD